MQKSLVFLIFFTPCFSFAQLTQSLEKIVIDGTNIYVYAEPNENENVFRLLRLSSNSVDTVFKYSCLVEVLKIILFVGI